MDATMDAATDAMMNSTMDAMTSFSSVQLRTPPFCVTLPAPVVFHAATLPAQAIYPRHAHAWGEFVYAFSGVMEIKLADHHYLAPPRYGIWLPPATMHVGFNRHAASFCSIYLAPELCTNLPGASCALTVGPLLRAILDELRGDPPPLAPDPAQQRLLQVVLDQLERAPHAGSYLPGSNDPLLAPVLKALAAWPGDPRSLPQWAQMVNTTERTLMRRCQRDLGMSLIEWRQRLKVIEALALLEQGCTVEAIGLGLGYSSASAFIIMFRKMMGNTPDEYRKDKLGGC
jgi:AraC-like DNA-binding protein